MRPCTWCMSACVHVYLRVHVCTCTCVRMCACVHACMHLDTTQSSRLRRHRLAAHIPTAHIEGRTPVKRVGSWERP